MDLVGRHVERKTGVVFVDLGVVATRRGSSMEVLCALKHPSSCVVYWPQFEGGDSGIVAQD